MESTTAVDLESVSTVTERLQQLLLQVRALKHDSTIIPLIPSRELIVGVDVLHDVFDEGYDQTYRYFAVETASRRLLYSFISSTDINDPEFAQVWDFLDLVLLCSDRGKCTPELVCWLIEELLDSQTTDGCRTVFDYLESRRERLAQKDFHKKNLVFLRSCNELLRRLSRAEDAIFCGRVFFFLFQTFPLGDKSSVNLRGEFHVENVTRFDISQHEDGVGDSGADNMEVDSQDKAEKLQGPIAPTPKPGSKAVPVKATPRKVPEEKVLPNNELYPIFWRLQHDFSDPTRLFDPISFTIFKKGLANTMTKFKQTPTVVQTKPGDEDKRGTKRKLGGVIQKGSADHHIDNYNPKYLTSRDLFHLELSDLAFQRHILVQALILIDFLLSLTGKAKKRLAAVSTPNKSLLYSFTLSDDDIKWTNLTKQDIGEYLAATGEGRQYFRMVETVLARDKNWVRWKVESCPSIVRGPVSTEEEMAARKGARDATRPRRVPDRPMNAIDLSFLDEGSGGGLEALKNPTRYLAPTIEQFVDGIKTDKLDEEMAMDDDEKSSLQNAIANKKWRALRLARASNLGLLDKADTGTDLEEILTSAPDRGGHEGDAADQTTDEGDGLAIAVTREDSTLAEIASTA